ncbi:MAG: PQQ-binding-like beta-propeller repeat protein [Pseudomonadales bacterium]
MGVHAGKHALHRRSRRATGCSGRTSAGLVMAFAFPGASRARSQPALYGDHILVCKGMAVYALSLADGCAAWIFQAAVEVRSAVVVNADGTRAFFGDLKGRVYAIDPRSGQGLWQAQANDHPTVTLTGSPRWDNGALYVPLSSSERAARPTRAMPAAPSAVARRWTLPLATSADGRAIADAPAPTGEMNAHGAPRYHPAGYRYGIHPPST